MSLIIRNLNCITASGLQTLVETARGAVDWYGYQDIQESTGMKWLMKIARQGSSHPPTGTETPLAYP
jgi:hypothetical protein